MKELKIRYEELKRNNNLRASANENYNKNVEDDLIYYKNLVREYERQIDDLRRMNISNNNDSVNQNKYDDCYKYNRERVPNRDNTNNNIYEQNLNINSEIYKNYNLDREKLSNNKYQISEENNPSGFTNNTLDNFRRNKVKN
jgi:hypothetical protein